MVGFVTILAAVFLLVMTALGLALTWLSIRDTSHTPPAVRSDDAE